MYCLNNPFYNKGETIEQSHNHAKAYCYYLKGKCLTEKKEFEAALNALTKACELNPDNELYSKLKSDTQKVLFQQFTHGISLFCLF